MAIIVNAGLARQRFDYSWEIPPTQKSYRRAFAWPRCGARWIQGEKKGEGEGAGICERSRRKNIWNWLPWFPTCHPGHRLFPFATSAGITNSILAHLCFLGGVYHRGVCVSRAARGIELQVSLGEGDGNRGNPGWNFLLSRILYLFRKCSLVMRWSRCSVKFLQRFFWGGRRNKGVNVREIWNLWIRIEIGERCDIRCLVLEIYMYIYSYKSEYSEEFLWKISKDSSLINRMINNDEQIMIEKSFQFLIKNYYYMIYYTLLYMRIGNFTIINKKLVRILNKGTLTK